MQAYSRALGAKWRAPAKCRGNSESLVRGKSPHPNAGAVGPMGFWRDAVVISEEKCRLFANGLVDSRLCHPRTL